MCQVRDSDGIFKVFASTSVSSSVHARHGQSGTARPDPGFRSCFESIEEMLVLSCTTPIMRGYSRANPNPFCAFVLYKICGLLPDFSLRVRGFLPSCSWIHGLSVCKSNKMFGGNKSTKRSILFFSSFSMCVRFAIQMGSLRFFASTGASSSVH
jgi:hypothetical protein